MMSRPNSTVRTQCIPHRPRTKSVGLKKNPLPSTGTEVNPNKSAEAVNDDTQDSSYYSLFNSAPCSEPRLKVIERYEELLNLSSHDHIAWTTSESPLNSALQSRERLYILKQVCPGFNMERPSATLKSISECEITPTITAENIQTEGGFNQNCNKIFHSRGIDVDLKHKIYSNTSKYLVKKNVPTLDSSMQVGIPGTKYLLSHTCDTQTDISCLERQSQLVQASSKSIPQEIQTTEKSVEDKLVSTNKVSCQPSRDGFTQTYELITENDLLCMEWIDKNLFRVPMNPHTIVVDKEKAASEFTCLGTNVFEQELIWEGQALY